MDARKVHRNCEIGAAATHLKRSSLIGLCSLLTDLTISAICLSIWRDPEPRLATYRGSDSVSRVLFLQVTETTLPTMPGMPASPWDGSDPPSAMDIAERSGLSCTMPTSIGFGHHGKHGIQVGPTNRRRGMRATTRTVSWCHSGRMTPQRVENIADSGYRYE